MKLEMDELAQFAKNNLRTDRQLARFFYYWIGSNIKYDYEFLTKAVSNRSSYGEYLDKQDAYRVFDERKGVCAGYASLYNWFMEEVGIDVVYISGHIRNEQNWFEMVSPNQNTGHAWNAVRLNDEWVLVDTTWGASYSASETDLYFDMQPEIAIITHFPRNRKWQLLENPLTFREFSNSKYVKPVWFYAGFTDIPKFKELGEYYYFIYRTNTKNKDLSIKLEISEDNTLYRPVENAVQISQSGFTYLRFAKKGIPAKAYYKANLYRSAYSVNREVVSFRTF